MAAAPCPDLWYDENCSAPPHVPRASLRWPKLRSLRPSERLVQGLRPARTLTAPTRAPQKSPPRAPTAELLGQLGFSCAPGPNHVPRTTILPEYTSFQNTRTSHPPYRPTTAPIKSRVASGHGRATAPLLPSAARPVRVPTRRYRGLHRRWASAAVSARNRPKTAILHFAWLNPSSRILQSLQHNAGSEPKPPSAGPA